MTMEPLSDDAGRGFLYTFAENIEAVVMGVFLAIFIIMTTFSVAIFMIVRILRNRLRFEEKMSAVILHFTASGIMVLSDLIWGGDCLELRLPFDMLIALFPMLVITSSVWEEKMVLRVSQCVSYFVWLLSLFYFLRGRGLFWHVESLSFLPMSGVVLIVICLVFLTAVFIQMREIRRIMKNGNVWSSVCMTLDVIYLLSSVICVTALFVASRMSMICLMVVSAAVSMLITLEMVALGLRVSFDSLFVIWRRHERLIVESMKISQNDICQDSSKINEMYKDIYTRIVSWFENEKPYLNSELTINDVVKVTFTNKLYISRAINQFTGRNFCQFVNYYRVLHSIEIFRQNPDLKVIDLATQSGFNSTVTFSMAFRLYMSECPSDWCRKEKFKLKRRKK